MKNYSQLNEQDAILELFSILEAPKKFIDLGCSDGETHSNTKALALQGWEGISIDKQRYENNIVQFVTLDNISDNIDTSVDYGFVSLDVDGNDFWFADWFFRNVSFKAIIVEINHQYADGFDYTMPYIPDYAFNNTTFYGASYTAFVRLASRYGFVPIFVNKLNAMFVAKEDAAYVMSNIQKGNPSLLSLKHEYKHYRAFKKHDEGVTPLLDNASNYVMPFNKDRMLEKRMLKFIDENDIDIVIETGTHYGYTTLRFANIPDMLVYSIEIKKEFHDVAKNALQSYKNVTLLHGSSAEILGNVISDAVEKYRNAFLSSTGKRKPNVLFYLDAHWYVQHPMRAEFEHIAKNSERINTFIAIHDFDTGKKGHGFDHLPKDGEGKRQPLNMEFVEPMLKTVYGIRPFKTAFNEVNKAMQNCRGCLFVSPK